MLFTEIYSSLVSWCLGGEIPLHRDGCSVRLQGSAGHFALACLDGNWRTRGFHPAQPPENEAERIAGSQTKAELQAAAEQKRTDTAGEHREDDHEGKSLKRSGEPAHTGEEFQGGNRHRRRTNRHAE